MKKLFTLFICLCAIVALQAQTATAPSNIGEVNVGTSSNPYKIATLENLYWIAASNADVPSPDQATRWAAYYEQTADIDASATSTWFSNGLGGYYGWPTIGGASGDFTGTYDGQGHTITGLYISRPDYVGLFGCIKGATIQNLKLSSVSVTNSSTGTGTGALVGYAFEIASTIDNCSSSGSVSGITNVGGLIGVAVDVPITIIACSSTCTVTGTTTEGGLIGSINPVIIPTPTTQASAISFSDITFTGMTIGWTNGNGNSRAVFVKEGTGAIPNPVDQTTYSASADWSAKGTQLGTSGYYCVYNGSGNSVTLTHLLLATQYTVQVFEYDEVSNLQKYLIATAADNPKSQATLMPTITSATYDASTGGLVLTCTDIATGDVISPAKMALTGEGGAYALTTPDVTASSSTSVNIVLNNADKATINQIFNKNGTSSTGGTTYNLAAADDWDASVTTGNIADLTGNEVTVSNLASSTITTQAVTSIGSTTATGNGNITGLGVPNATQYGVVWSTSTNPTVSLSTKTTEGTASATGAFTSGITGLASGTTYYVKAYATNSVGTVYGDEVSFTTITVPDAPTIGTATAGDTQVSVSFTAPAFNGGSTITGYTVTSSPGNFTGSGATSPIIVTGLTNSTAYTFTITATNIVGTSTASAASNSVTPNTSQTITFANPGAQTFGTSPTLSAIATSGLNVTFSTTTSDVCSITPEGVLTFKKAGSCTILADQAGNIAYTAAPTVSQSFTVNAVISGIPTIGTATAGDGQASVSFTAPASTGGADVTYTATSNPGNLTGTGATSPITVTGLSNGTAYTFTVTATNVAGTSTASTASNSVTAYSAPTVTTDVAGDITSSGVTLKGIVAANGASTAVTFEYGTTNAYGTSVTATQSPVAEIAGIAVSKAITGLTANTTYHYRVVGVNAGGTTNGLDQTFKTDLGTGLDNAAATVLSLYPNPATEGFYINVGEKTTLISISDLNGSLVLTQQATGKSYVSINLLQKGVYVVKTNGLVAKLVKK
jgi:hypothetical protein